ncbi:MAG: hypothetical protein QM755_22130 [Luteolibacter sp.]
MRPLHLVLASGALAAAVLPHANAAASIGINFNNSDTAGSQLDGNLGAAWTNVNTASGTSLTINGGDGATLNWASSNFYQGGAWTSSTVGGAFNTPIGMMRVYLDDGDGPTAGSPGSLGAVNGDSIGVTVNLTGLTAWLAAEGGTSYTIQAYFSTDMDSATFLPISVRDGGSVTSTVIETITPTVQGNGSWNGSILDPGAIQTDGTRGSAVFSTQFTQDTITLTLPVRDGSARGTLAGIIITAAPEPSAALLGTLGTLALLRRRRG